MNSLRARVISITGMLGVLLLLWACYPAAEVTYSNPQNTTSQWLIEYRTTDNSLHLTLRYRRGTDSGGFSYNDSGFNVTLDQLTGLTRDQLMSSAGTNGSWSA